MDLPLVQDLDSHCEHLLQLISSETAKEKKEKSMTAISRYEADWMQDDRSQWSTFLRPQDIVRLRPKAGERAILSLLDPPGKSFSGTVHRQIERGEDKLKIVLSGIGEDSKPPPGPYRVSFPWDPTKSQRIESALSEIRHGSNLSMPMISNLLRGPTTDLPLPPCFIGCNGSPFPLLLNKYQRRAVQAPLCRWITLVHGPPGTGKTVTAVGIILTLIRTGHSPILVCAGSNTAVDNLLLKLQDYELKVTRVYSTSKVHSPQVLDSIAWHHLKSKQKQLQLARDFEIIGTTCIGSKSEELKDLHPSVVLIDECMQANEPECLVPISKGANRIVLLGDHRQLGPVVRANRGVSGNLGVTLYERLQRLGHPTHQLLIQHRMHPGIALFPSNHFYQGTLKNSPVTNDLSKNVQFPWPNPSQPMVVWANVNSTEDNSEGCSYKNSDEAMMICDLVVKLIVCGFEKRKISVITPYLAQRTEIMKRLYASGADLDNVIEVSSVDGYQGRENDFIIFSTVRSNDPRKVGFLRDERRLNVALTRARRGLFIITNPWMLQSIKAFRKLMDHCFKHGLVVNGKIEEWKEADQNAMMRLKLPGPSKTLSAARVSPNRALSCKDDSCFSVSRESQENRRCSVLSHPSSR